MPQELNLDRYKKIEMTNGAVLWCRTVPPYAQAEARATMPTPPVPRVEVRSGSGANAEVHRALPGTPEYEAWVVEQQKHRQLLGMAIQRFSANYSVVAWQLPGEEVRTAPPDDWEIPPVMQGYEAFTIEGADHRAQYILYELVQTGKDQDALEAVMFPDEVVTKEAVAAALAPFVSNAKDNP